MRAWFVPPIVIPVLIAVGFAVLMVVRAFQ